MKRKQNILLVVAMMLAGTLAVEAQIPRTISFQGVLTDAAGIPLADRNYSIEVTLFDAATGGNALYNETQQVQVVRGVFNMIIGQTAPIPGTVPFDRQYWLGIKVDGGAEIAPRTQLTSVPYALNAQHAMMADSANRANRADHAVNADLATEAGTVTGGFVSSFNGVQGAINFVAGTGTTITRSGNDITIAASGDSESGVDWVQNTDRGLIITNMGGPIVTVNVREGGIRTEFLADNSVITPKIQDEAVTTSKLANGAVTTIKITDLAVTTEKINDLAVTNAKLGPSSVTSDKIADGTIATVDIANNAVTNAKLAPNAVTTDKILDGTIITADLADGSVTSAKILDGDVQTVDLANSSVTNAKLADNSVTSNKIVDGTIITADLADGSVTLPKISPAGAASGQAITFNGSTIVWGNPTPGGPAGGDLTGTYPNPQIAPNAVTSPKILDGTIQTVDLADNSVTSAKILDGTVNTVDLADASITNAKLAPNAVTTDKILDGTVNTVDLADASVTNPKLADNSVTSNKIVDGTIVTADLADGSVTTAKILDGTVNTVDLADGSVTTAKILDGTVNTVDLANSSVTSAKILDGDVQTVDHADASITNPKLADNSVTSNKIVDGTVVTADLADGSVTSAKILDGTIVTADMADNSVTSLKIIDGTIVTADLADGSITSAKILDATISTADVASNAIDASKISTAGAITVGSFLQYNGGITPVWSTNGSALTALNASNITSGTLNDARLSSNVPLLNGVQTFAGTNTFNGTGTYNGTNTFNGSVNFNGTVTFANAIDVNAANNFMGNGSDAVQLTIRGPGAGFGADHLLVNGNIRALGTITSGLSILINGFSNPRRITGDAAMTISTTAGQLTLQSGSGTVGVTGNLSITGSINVATINAGTINGTFVGDGSGMTNLNASNITTGTLNDARLSANVPLKNAANTFTGVNTFGTLNATTITSTTFNGGTFNGTHTGDGAALTNLNASNIATGTLNDARLSANVPLKNAANTFTGVNTFGTVNGTTFNGGTFNGTFVGDGAGVTNMNASNIATGTLNDARLSANVPLKNAANTFTGVNTFGTVNGTTFNGGTFNGTFVGDGAGVTNMNASNIATGTLNDARLSANVPLKNAANTFTGVNTFGTVNATTINGGTFNGTFVGDGAAVTNINASNIATGTLNDARLSANVPLKNAANTFTGVNTFGTVNGTTFNGGTFNGTFVGDGAGVTNINASNIATGTLALARISTAGAVADQALMYDGANLVYGNPAANTLNLPFAQTANSGTTLFTLTNTNGAVGGAGSFIVNNAANSGAALSASTNGTGSAVSGTATGSGNAVVGVVSPAGTGSAGSFTNNNGGNATPALTATTNGTGTAGTFTTLGTGSAVSAVVNSAGNLSAALSATTNGLGSAGSFTVTVPGNNSPAVSVSHAGLGNGISVSLPNASNGARGIDVAQAGVGPGVFATSAGGNALWGITSSISAAGVIGDNTFGEAVVGRNRGGNGVGAVVGRNDSSGYGVRGFNTKNGVGVIGQAGISGGTGTAGRFENVNAANVSPTMVVTTNGIGNGISVTLPNASNGARGIDVTQSGVGPGVFATSAGGNAVWGITSSISAAGVIGDNTFGEAIVGRNRGGNGVGAVVGRNDSSGYGVRGFNTKDGIGVIGQAGISGGTGTAGRFENVNAANVNTTMAVATNGIGNGITVQLTNASNGGRGLDVTQTGVGPGVFATSAGGNAVWGITSSISAAGVIGDNTFGEAVVGRNRGGNGVGAVVGRNDSSGYGVRGFNTKNGYGVLGQAGISGGTGTAGRFENVNAANTSDALQVVTNSAGNAARFTGNVVVNGNLTVSGTVAKGGGSFKIDHPLDPQNRYLYHSFVESPEMKNIYDGVVKLNDNGEAVVELPEYFEALNMDFRYQLTAMGAPGPGLYIAEEVQGNTFKVAGGKPGMRVSWMVTGVRHDAYAQKHRIQVDVAKPEAERGTYLHPEAFGVESIKEAPTTLNVDVQGMGTASSQNAGAPQDVSRTVQPASVATPTASSQNAGALQDAGKAVEPVNVVAPTASAKATENVSTTVQSGSSPR